MRTLSFLMIAFLLLAGNVACGVIVLGDPTQNVYIHNATEVTVMVDQGFTTVRGPTLRVGPGETRRVPWTISEKSTKQQTVKAYDESGNLLFCKRYDGPALKEAEWRIEIVKGEIACD